VLRPGENNRLEEHMAVVTMRQLLGAGVHFGHQTRRWNPKMRRYILGERNGIYLIDLHKTLDGIESAYGFVRDLVAGGGSILFVGTKKQTQGPVADFAAACGMPFVNQRWLGGMLTNFTTVSGRVKRMQDLRTMQAAGDFEAMPKREALRHVRELEKLSRNLGGISGLEKLPDAIFVIDTKKEHIAVTEANKLRLPVVAVVDTNCDPDVIDYVIPGNDDAIRSGALLCRVMADAVVEGRFIAAHRPASRAQPAAPSAPSAPTPPRPRPRANIDASHPEPPPEPAPAGLHTPPAPAPRPPVAADVADQPAPQAPVVADPVVAEPVTLETAEPVTAEATADAVAESREPAAVTSTEE
jgi:small subunit ribosomal protein S2